MTVFDNIAFGLKIKKYSEDKIKKEVDEVMRIVGLEGLGDRMPKELSVGQQQRVALARSIVVRPNILLYDEPLGNVEYSLQRKMLMEIKQIHRKVGFTSIYVTHDQEQAMSLADKIMVMNQGMIEQIGSPNDVYFNPKSIFVAKFVGEVNMLKGKVKSLIEDSAIVETSVGEFEAKLRGRRIQAEKVAYAIRPERMIIGDSAKNCHNKLEAEIVESVYKGSDVNYIVKLQDHSLFKISLQGEVLKEKKLEGKVLIGWNSEDAILLDKPSIIPQIDIEKAILGA
jgi:ABC-type Fe3+/spermidine/putrescine transport system ATPase subunit